MSGSLQGLDKFKLGGGIGAQSGDTIPAIFIDEIVRSTRNILTLATYEKFVFYETDGIFIILYTYNQTTTRYDISVIKIDYKFNVIYISNNIYTFPLYCAIDGSASDSSYIYILGHSRNTDKSIICKLNKYNGSLNMVNVSVASTSMGRTCTGLAANGDYLYYIDEGDTTSTICRVNKSNLFADIIKQPISGIPTNTRLYYATSVGSKLLASYTSYPYTLYLIDLLTLTVMSTIVNPYNYSGLLRYKNESVIYIQFSSTIYKLDLNTGVNKLVYVGSFTGDLGFLNDDYITLNFFTTAIKGFTIIDKKTDEIMIESPNSPTAQVGPVIGIDFDTNEAVGFDGNKLNAYTSTLIYKSF